MKTRKIFWGVIILVIGVLLLLNTMGFLPFSIWQIFWPVMLIVLGLWFLLGSTLFKKHLKAETFSLPLEGAQTAEIEFNHGAGELIVSALSAENRDLLLDGLFTGGLEPEFSSRNGLSRLKLRPPLDFIPFGMFPHTEGFNWDVALSPQLPLKLHFKTGADKSSLNLQDLNVSDLKLETGASDTSITLPSAASHTKVNVNSGAAAVNIRVPEGVAARIRISSGLMGIDVDQVRFPMSAESEPGHKVFQSPGYETSLHQAEIIVESGLGSISIQ
jgi:hypothetical protein